jgi:hypothetical protein
MNLLSTARMCSRFAVGLPGHLRRRLSLDEARAIVRRRFEERESNFLRLAKQGVYGYPRSPYLPLLRQAGCDFDDLRSMVHTQGLDAALRELRSAGVYVTFEQFKGREPIICGGQTFEVRAEDFNNPFQKHHYETSTGGSSGPSVRIPTDLHHLAAQAPPLMLMHEAHDVLHVPTALWFGVLPDGSGINVMLRLTGLGQIPRRWFAPVISSGFEPSLANRLTIKYLVLAGRIAGVPIPAPEPCGLDRVEEIARWMEGEVRAAGGCLIITHVSKALRISRAAWEAGIDLKGCTFCGAGEPVTPAKVEGIRQSNAGWIPFYPFTEAGLIGVGCSRPVDGNDMHFVEDCFGLIQWNRQVPGAGVEVGALNFTSLLPTAPKILLNVESDDYGILEKRNCGCPLEDAGYALHLRDIFSFSKLTGEGVTLVGSEMLDVLERVLPQRFGGTPLDYQLMEEELDSGLTQLSLVVSPEIKIDSEAELVEAVVSALHERSVAADMAQTVWREARTLKIKRAEPEMTARGKLMPLCRRSLSTQKPEGHANSG